jgi:outer membrane murein-binding lipoprotein Lpp
MSRIAAFVSIVLIMGCGDNEEMNRLRQQVETLQTENATIRASLPSEKPKVVKELEEARKANAVLQRELGTLQHNLNVKSSEIPPEMLPLAKMIADLKERIETLERTASRKGHTHQYEDSYPIGTFNTQTKSTQAEK